MEALFPGHITFKERITKFVSVKYSAGFPSD